MTLLFLALTGILFLLAARFYSNTWSRGVRIGVEFGQESIRVGEQTELVETVENHKRMPIAAMEVAFRVPKGLLFLDAENTMISDYVYKRDVFSMRGMEKIYRTYHLTGTQRGQYRISHISCVSPGLFFKSVFLSDLQDPEQTLYVYPAKSDVSGILRAAEVLQGEKQSMRRVYEDPFAFSSIREYQTTDPMKSVNWKATARAGKLMVNTYAAPVSEQIRILLDLEDEGVRRQPEEIEQSISAAATLYALLAGKNQPVRLQVGVRPAEDELAGHAGAILQPEGICFNGNRITEVMRFFTRDFTEDPKVPARELLEAALRQTSAADPGGIPVLITKNADEALVRDLSGLLRKRGRGAGAAPEKILLVVPCRDRAEYGQKHLPSDARGITVLPFLTVKD